MFFEKIINIFDFYHQKRIINYLKKLNLKYFIDVGAHKGEFLSYILSLNYKKIYCFEPQKKNFFILYKNFKNKKNVQLFNLGLANKNSKIMFYENKLTSTSTFSKSINTPFSKIKNLILNSKNLYIDKYPINVRTLDEIFINKKIDNIFLKIDVEGFELNVLKGAKKLLSKKVKFILIEKHFFQLYKGNSTKKVHIFLKKNNFKLIKMFTFPLLYFQDNLYKKL
jgi:FkbM family methyltransferase